MKTPRISFIDGLKGLCGIWICIFHYILGFRCAGYIGWESGIPEAEKASYYFANFPFSILSNGSFPLYIFFALLAFVPALKYFETRDDACLKKQAVQHYFRLMPLVLVCTILGWLMFRFGLYANQELAVATQNNWLSKCCAAPISFLYALKEGLWLSLLSGTHLSNNALWCMDVIFYGALLTYAFLALFGTLKKRTVMYFALFLVTFIAPAYTAFLAGIVAADIMNTRRTSPHRESLGLFFVVLGLVIGNFPEVLLPSRLPILSVYGIGAFFLLAGCVQSGIVQKLLSTRWLTYAGKITFALILIHFPILMSFSAWLFMYVRDKNLPLPAQHAITLVATIPFVLLAAILFEKYVARNALKLSHRAVAFFNPET